MQLFTMAREVASGMKYLAGINFIHRVSITNRAERNLCKLGRSVLGNGVSHCRREHVDSFQ